jgi:type II restriction enzyme
MKFSPTFEKCLGCKNSDEVFSYLMANLNDSITYWDYFVNWPKVVGNVKELEIDLNTLNYLVGKTDVETAFKELLRKQGSIARLIPVLLACRQKEFKILVDFTDGKLSYESFTFKTKSSLTQEEITAVCKLATKSGLLEMFKDKIIKSVPDYVIGVEVGLDSNGRKNRGGTTMEKIVLNLIAPICSKNQFEYIPQATAAKIQNRWKVAVKVDDADRSFDFAIKTPKQLFLIETNYYGGGGSKLKATAGEYKDLYDVLHSQGFGFIWITDGQGWLTTKKPLRETFDRTDYILNINMILKGILEKILT